jgi:hypothetical protein
MESTVILIMTLNLERFSSVVIEKKAGAQVKTGASLGNILI